MTFRSITLLALPALVACGHAAPPDPTFVEEWADRAAEIAHRRQMTPPVASRVAAYAAVAMYEGHAADTRSGLRSLASQVNGLWNVPASDQPIDAPTVAAHAVREVLDSLAAGDTEARRVNDSIALSHTARRRASGVRKDRSERSVELGRRVGRAIVAWAALDGFTESRGRPWTAARSMAQWSPPRANTSVPSNGSVVLASAPVSASAIEPHWGRLRTFALRNADECAPPPPPAYSEARGSNFWKMGRELYDSLARATQEQRAAAARWSSDPLIVQAAWQRAAFQVVRAGAPDAARAAEAYALSSIAIADAYLGAWREKYRSLVVRPAGYLPRVIGGGAPAGEQPASPEYPAEQVVVAAAAAEALIPLFGDSIAVTDSSDAPRTWSGFSAIRNDVSTAALFGGRQFVPAVVHGSAQGQCIGKRVAGRIRTRW